MLAIEMYPADSSKVVNVSLAQYNPIPHVPEINKPTTRINLHIMSFNRIAIGSKNVHTQKLFVADRINNRTCHDVQNELDDAY